MGRICRVWADARAGKSTIVNLLCRLYDSSKGRLVINGNDVEKYDPVELRKHIAVLFQEKCTPSNSSLTGSISGWFLDPRECRNRSS
jgi:ABC-type cobalamin/Fe3+-siderophores transport system ATPase subunit